MSEPATTPAAPLPVIHAGATIPAKIQGKSPGDVAAKPTAVSGNPFDTFDRKLTEAAAAQPTSAPSAVPVTRPGNAEPSAPPPAPAATQPAPQPAVPFDPSNIPADFRPKAEHWKTVNAERMRLREELAATKKQIEELGDITTLKNIAAEKANLEKQLRMVAAERDPELQRTFTSQREALLEEAKGAVPSELSSKVESILKRHGAASAPHLRDFIREHDLDAFGQSQLAAVVAGLRSLETNRERIVQESADNWNKLVTEQKLTSERQQQQAQRELQQALEDRLGVVQKENPLFQVTTKEEEPEVAEAIAIARRVAQGNVDIEERLNAALATAAYPRLVKAYQKLHADYNQLQTAAQSLRGATPGAGGRSDLPSGDTGGVVPAEGGRGRDAGDIMERLIAQRGIQLPV